MLKLNLQLCGGRGASSGGGSGGAGGGGGVGGSSSGGGGGTYETESDFEKSLTGYNDPRLQEYSSALESEQSYNAGLKQNLNQAINESGYTNFTDAVISSELKDAQTQLNNIPKMKTPAQLGQAQALKDRISILNDLKKKKGTKGNGVGDVDIFA